MFTLINMLFIYLTPRVLLVNSLAKDTRPVYREMLRTVTNQYGSSKFP